MTGAFERAITRIAGVSAAMFTVAGCMLTYEVVARYFFTKPTIWAAELSQLCLIWGCLLAMAWALSAKRHIAVDALVNRLSETARAWVQVAAMAIVAAFSAIVVWQGALIFWDSFERGRTTGSLLDLPQWIAELPVPLGFALLAVQAVIEMHKAMSGMAKTDDGPHP